jgi:selenocysteine-specific elongation factor
VAALAAGLRAAAQLAQPRSSQGLFRLAIDRAFTLAGHGTVVTGTVFAGRVEAGATLDVLPSGIEVRVRSIHAQNRAASEGRAGERCALNITGIEVRSVNRGDWLADRRGMAVTERADARLRLLPSEATVLGGYTPVHVHFGSTHVTAHVLLLEGERLRPGETCRVQFVFDRPVCIATGERFVLRNAQATSTLGGGWFLDARAPGRRRRSEGRRGRLDAIEAMIATGDVAALLQSAPWGLSRADIVLVTGLPADVLTVPPDVRQLAAGRTAEDEYWIHDSRWHAARERILTALAALHEGHPIEPGPDAGRLRRIAAPEAPESAWREAVESLVREGRIRRQGAWLQLPEHAAELSAREVEAVERLLPLMMAGRFDPPWVRDLAARTGEPETRVRQLLAALGREGRALAIVRDLYYPRETIAELAAVIDRLAVEHGAVPAAAFRDAIGLGRKRSIQILEFFDRVGYTRRVGDTHVLRGGDGWHEVR